LDVFDVSCRRSAHVSFKKGDLVFICIVGPQGMPLEYVDDFFRELFNNDLSNALAVKLLRCARRFISWKALKLPCSPHSLNVCRLFIVLIDFRSFLWIGSLCVKLVQVPLVDLIFCYSVIVHGFKLEQMIMLFKQLDKVGKVILVFYFFIFVNIFLDLTPQLVEVPPP
jgi:hypothetical protein